MAIAVQARAKHRADATDAPSDEEFRGRALDRLARERLARIDERRDVADLSGKGKTQREIAAVLNTTQPRIGRIEKAIAYLGDVSEVTPEELILRAHVDGTDRGELVKVLCAISYTEGEYAPYPAEGKAAGTWDQVRHAYMSGFLSEDEYAEIRAAARVS